MIEFILKLQNASECFRKKTLNSVINKKNFFSLTQSESVNLAISFKSSDVLRKMLHLMILLLFARLINSKLNIQSTDLQ